MKPLDAQPVPFPVPRLLTEICMDEFLRHAISSPAGCPLCRAAERDEYYLLIWLTRVVGEDDARHVFEIGPLCNFHAAIFPKVAAGKATARLCRYLLAQQDAEAAETGSADDAEPGRCPICLMLAARQDQWLGSFDAVLGDERNRRLYAAGDGLCVPHLHTAQTRLGNGATTDFLDRCSCPQRERLLVGLDLFIQQGHFHAEPSTWGVWKRAREKLFGCPGLTIYLSRRCAEGAPSNA
jgi:hypothetical protein